MKERNVVRAFRWGLYGSSCLLLLLTGLLLIPASDAFAGLVFDEKVEFVRPAGEAGGDRPSPRPRESTTYFQGKKVRTETKGHVYILDFEKKVMINLNPSTKTYSEMSLEDLKAAQNQAMEWMKNLRAQMVQNMEKLPPESRAEMQKKLDSLPQSMFEPQKPGKITVKATGKKEKINGFDCQLYEVFENGEKSADYWVTKSVSNKAFDMYQNRLGKWLEGMGPLAANRLEEWESVRDKGFPIRVIRLKPTMGQIAFNREILRVEEKSLSESLFKPPDDYRRVESPTLPKMGAKPPMPPMPPAKPPQMPPVKPKP